MEPHGDGAARESRPGLQQSLRSAQGQQLPALPLGFEKCPEIVAASFHSVFLSLKTGVGGGVGCWRVALETEAEEY